MLKVGEFSRLSQVTIPTLHHYDDIGLLKPAHVDKFTNHRYYTIAQLSQIHRIIALKELGLSLDQIRLMLNDAPSKEQIRGMLVLQEAKIQEQLRAENVRLSLVKFRLRMLEMEEEMPEFEIIVKKLEPVRVLQIRKVCAGFPDIEALGMEIEDALEHAGIHLGENQFQTNIFHSEDYRIEDIDITFTFPVADTFRDDVPLATLGTMTVEQLPAVETAATYVQNGISQDNLQESLVMLQRWCVAKNYELADEYRFVFYKGPQHSHISEEWVVEIQHVVNALAA